MTDRKQALIALRDKVKAGDASGKFGPIMGLYWDFDTQIAAMRAYNGSLDAAHALHKAMLPEYFWNVGRENEPRDKVGIYDACVEGRQGEEFIAHADTPARAWLIAILEALIAEADQ